MCNKRWVIITGGTSGIGKQVTIDFAQNGDNIIFTYRNKKDVAIKLAKSLVENYRIECIPVHLDLNNMESVNGFIQVIEDKKINVDILINNAATFLAKDCKEINSDLWDFLMIQNAKSPLLLTVGIVKKFMGNGGSIVNISSISSSRVSENQGLYALSKSCIDVMTKYLAIELCNQNINVNAIAPGLIKTNMSKNVWTDKALLESIVNNIPDKRIGIPKDISNIVMFLTSSKAKWIKGQTIIADGGASLTH